MSNLLLGVNVTDGKPAERPVQSASTSVAAFVGVTERGPVNESVRVTSWSEFTRKFGGFIAASYLAYAVRSFFVNGGTVAHIVRIVHYTNITTANTKTSSASTYTFKDSVPADAIKISAVGDGKWGDHIDVQITNNTSTFDLTVSYEGVVVERYTKLTLDTVEQDINGKSNFIIVDALGTVLPATGTHALAGGSDGLASIADADYIGDPSTRTGLYALDAEAVNLIAVPGVTTKVVHDAMTAYCSGRGDCFAVLDAPMGISVSAVEAYKGTLTASDYGALYYPWVKSTDPIGVGANPLKLVPRSGSVMGIMARTDASRGVWKAPAGEVDGLILDAVEVETKMTDTEATFLKDAGINAIHILPGAGIAVWGDRTLSGGYVNHQRLKLMLKATFKSNYRWTVFEPIDDTILGPTGRVETSGSAFMRNLFNQGAFDGKVAAEAFSVLCRRDNNPKEQTDIGRLNIDVAYRVKGVAEVVVISISQTK